MQKWAFLPILQNLERENIVAEAVSSDWKV